MRTKLAFVFSSLILLASACPCAGKGCSGIQAGRFADNVRRVDAGFEDWETIMLTLNFKESGSMTVEIPIREQ